MKRWMFALAVILITGAITFMYTPKAETAPSGGKGIMVYFSPNGGGEKAMANLIRSARKEVFICIYMFTSRVLAQAVMQAHGRGIKVALVMDSKESTAAYGKAKDFVEKGIDVKFVKPQQDSRGGRYSKFHHKFAVIDGKYVITGSFNWTQAADILNQENVLIINNKTLAKAYRKEFSKWYKRGDSKMPGRYNSRYKRSR